MKLFLVLIYVLSYSFVSGQTCVSLPLLPTIENDFYLAVNASDQTGSTFILGELFFDCITYGSPDGSTFREMRITAKYQVDSGTFFGQVLYACVDFSNGTIGWVSGDGVTLKSGSRTENGTERCRDCRNLSPTTCTS